MKQKKLKSISFKKTQESAEEIQKEKEILRGQMELILADFRKIFFKYQIDYLNNKNDDWVRSFEQLQMMYRLLDHTESKKTIQVYREFVMSFRPSLDKALAMK